MEYGKGDGGRLEQKVTNSNLFYRRMTQLTLCTVGIEINSQNNSRKYVILISPPRFKPHLHVGDLLKYWNWEDKYSQCSWIVFKIIHNLINSILPKSFSFQIINFYSIVFVAPWSSSNYRPLPPPPARLPPPPLLELKILRNQSFVIKNNKTDPTEKYFSYFWDVIFI